MSVQGIGGYGVAAQGAGGQSGTQGGGAAASGSANDPVQDFLSYMKETPAQRMEDAWLKAHGLTRQQLAAMSPDQRKAVMEQMKQDIERQVKTMAQTRQDKTASLLSS